jgi:pyrroloquinoline quinone biosynthesis protein D
MPSMQLIVRSRVDFARAAAILHATMEPIAASARPRLSLRARVQTDRLTGKPVLLYPEGVLMLNATAEAIIALCDGQMTVDEILKQLAERYSVRVEEIAPEVGKYLERLRTRNLLELNASPSG